MPEQFKVIRQVRAKLAWARCDKILQAEAPSRPIERGIAGPGLLAHVLVSKYSDHLPLYRQAEIYAWEGVELDRSTMAEWVGGCSRLLEPLVEALRRHVMSATKLHTDDTPVPVLASGRGKTKTGRLWTYARDEHPQAHLSEFMGTLQADAYAGYCRVYEGGRVQEAWMYVACPPAVLRIVRDAQIAGGKRSAGTDRGPVYHRRRDPRRFRRGTACGSERVQQAIAGIAEEVVRRDFGQALEEIRYHQGHSRWSGGMH